MIQQTSNTRTGAAAFDTVAQADQAIRQLRSAGFAEDQLAVICPANFTDHFRSAVPHSETPDAGEGEALAKGGALGATLGGLALAAAALTGVGGIAAAGVLIGGGAIAGGFSNLIVAKGYEHEPDDFCKHAVQRGEIVVGVEVRQEEGAARLAEAKRILNAAGGREAIP